MSVRSLKRDNDTLDKIICYFMRTILHLQTAGVEHLPLAHSLKEPFGAFLDIAMEIFMQSPGPEIARMLLEAEYSAAASRGPITAQTALNLQMIKELAWHIHYDADIYSYLLTTENLWGNAACEYAAVTFYQNLPESVKEKYGIAEMIAQLPPALVRMDDF